ncbi:MAG: hypothetical protein SF029_00350 [bacterium]|nr:hypothetical protein [bacterium]
MQFTSRRTNAFIVLGLLLLLLTTVFGVVAQETTPEPPVPTLEPTLTATPTPTPTWTETATLTPSQTPIATNTETPTLTPPPTPETTTEVTAETTSTLQPTITLTPETTLEVSETPTSTETPELPLLLFDSFYPEHAERWSVGLMSMLVPDPTFSDFAVQFAGSGGDNLQFGMGLLDEIRLQARFAFSDGTVLIYTRHSGAGYYVTSFNTEGRIEIWRVDAQSRLLLAVGEAGLSQMTWRFLTLTLEGGTISVAVGETLVAAATDPNPLPSGTIGFYSEPTDGGPFWMDDFMLYGTQAQPSTHDSSLSFSADQPLQAQADSSPGEIVYIARPNGNGDIWTVNRDGSDEGPLLTSSSSSEDTPQWSPNGAKIVYNSNVNNQSGLWMINADGTGAEALYTLPSYSSYFPSAASWSPDSTRIAFTFAEDVYTYNVSSGNETKIVETQSSQFCSFIPDEPGEFCGAIMQPVWHPSQEFIAFTYLSRRRSFGNLTGSYSIVIVDLSGNEITRFRDPSGTALVGGSWAPMWSPEGDSIVTTQRVPPNYLAVGKSWPITIAGSNITVGASQPFPVTSEGIAFSPNADEIVTKGLDAISRTCTSPCQSTLITSTYNASNSFPNWKQINRIDIKIQLLSLYGITAYEDGVTSNITGGQEWLEAELDEIIQGVRDTAQALDIGRHGSFSADRSRILFTNVMGSFTIYRATNAFAYPTPNGAVASRCNSGTGNDACTDNFNGFIVFRGTLTNGITKYVLVHELGHRFNVRSDGGNGTSNNSLYGKVNETRGNCYALNSQGVSVLTGACITDRNDDPVMATVLQREGPVWIRGGRGWGSGPDTEITDFQQHPPGVFVGDDAQTVIDETAADMFLNWVYRTITDFPPSPLYQSSPPGTWQGFLNRNWNSRDPNPQTGRPCSETPCDDATYPGDARFAWMNREMAEIFAYNNTTWIGTYGNPTPTPTPTP